MMLMTTMMMTMTMTMTMMMIIMMMTALQGNVTNYQIPFDDVDGSSTSPAHLQVAFHNGAGLATPGMVKSALRLHTSQQYATVVDREPSCFVDLRLCHSGICIAFYLKISDAVSDIELVNSVAYSVGLHAHTVCVVFCPGSCRISQPDFLAECRNRKQLFAFVFFCGISPVAYQN